MAISKFEKRALNEINRIDEGLMLNLFKFFLKPKVKKAMKALAKDPEMKAAQRDYMYHAERLKKLVDKMGDSADPKLRKIANSI